MSTQTVESASLLVVDDDKLSRELLARHLQDSGHIVTVVHDGSMVLKLLEQHPFDLVLLAGSMPGIDGLETLAVIRKTYSVTALPVVMAAATDDSSDLVNAMKLGANDYVTKPLDIPVVLARVEAQLLSKQNVDRIRQMEKVSSSATGSWRLLTRRSSPTTSICNSSSRRLNGFLMAH